MIYENRYEEKLKGSIHPMNANPDFEDFWRSGVEALRRKKLTVSREKLDLPYDASFTTWEVKYNTHDETVVHAYFSVPNNGKKKHPCAVIYHGGGGKKEIHFDLIASGIACFAMDVRSQGGTTVDKASYSSGDKMGGIMTRGLLDKNEFYMRNIYLDAVRAIDTVATFDEVDKDNIYTFGGSQGGALSITASALSGKVKKCYSVVTSYCCIDRRVEDGTGVFEDTHAFLRTYPQYTDAVLDTLSYFDVNNMASLLKIPTSFCIALADKICFPEYVYSAYAHTDTEKELYMVPFAPHCVPKDYKLKVCREISKSAGK